MSTSVATRRSRPMFAARMAAASLVALAACSPVGIRLPAPVAFPTPEFERQPATQPAISSGRAGLPIVTFDPGLYVDDDGYHLFYTSIFCRRDGGYSYSWNPADPGTCDILNVIGTIAYAFSGDKGATWQFRQTPVVMPSDTGFDSAKIETASVFRLGDTLYLAYSADGDPGGRKLASRYQIGIAALALGGKSVREWMLDESTQFRRRPDPLLRFDRTPNRFDNNVQEPSVVVRPDGIFLFYIGLGLSLPEEPVDAPGQSIRSVGLGRAVLDRQLNVVSRSQSSLLDGANIPEVRYFDGAFHLFGTTMSPGEFHRGERLGYSTSVDGIRWSRFRPMLPGTAPGLDDWGMMAPTVAVELDRLVLFYTAYSAEPRECFPVPPTGRFGRPVAGGSQCLFITIGRAVAPRPALIPR